MDQNGIRERLVGVVLGHLKRPADRERLGLTTPLRGRGLGLDSLDLISLIVRVEEEFEIFFEADEIAGSVTTLGALLATVERKIGSSARGEN